MVVTLDYTFGEESFLADEFSLFDWIGSAIVGEVTWKLCKELKVPLILLAGSLEGGVASG
ncbi:unnamed protein product [Ilex paraguariensis]|uniref:Uncharacterized protein n=1 Tax=Ilex paraguariensis TaxID=185542 RepID=A0ABC8QNL3_9AQUA